LDEIGAHDGQNAQPQARRPFGIAHPEDVGGVQDDQERGQDQKRHQHPPLHHGEENADGNDNGEAGDAQPQGLIDGQQAARDGAAAPAEGGPACFVIQTAPAVEIFVEDVDRRMGDQQPEGRQKGVPRVEGQSEPS
jgi:hypothetical protein